MVDYIDHDYNNINIYPDNFEQQICYLHENYRLSSYEELIFDSNSDDIQIAITFDDVFAGFKNNVYPIINKYQVPVKLFLTAQYLLFPQEFWMNELARLLLEGKKYKSEFLFSHPIYQYAFPTTNYQERVDLYHSLKFILGGLDQNERENCMMQVRNWVYMDRGDRKEYMPLDIEFCKVIKDNPLISFGVHTDSHGFLGEMTYEEQYAEIFQCKSYLEKELQSEMLHFSYPFGSYNRMTKEILKKMHFRSACGSRQDYFDENKIDLFELPRITPPNIGKIKFAQWIDALCEKKDVDKENEFIVYVGKLKNDQTIYNEEKQCVLFGVGIFSEILLDRMHFLGTKAELFGFVDNDVSKQGKTFMGYPVFSPNLLKNDVYEVYIWHYSRSILEQLKQMSVGRIHLITGV